MSSCNGYWRRPAPSRRHDGRPAGDHPINRLRGHPLARASVPNSGRTDTAQDLATRQNWNSRQQRPMSGRHRRPWWRSHVALAACPGQPWQQPPFGKPRPTPRFAPQESCIGPPGMPREAMCWVLHRRPTDCRMRRSTRRDHRLTPAARRLRPFATPRRPTKLNLMTVADSAPPRRSSRSEWQRRTAIAWCGYMRRALLMTCCRSYPRRSSEPKRPRRLTAPRHMSCAWGLRRSVNPRTPVLLQSAANPVLEALLHLVDHRQRLGRRFRADSAAFVGIPDKGTQ